MKNKNLKKSGLVQITSLNDLECRVEDCYFLGIEVEKDIDLDMMTHKVNQLLREEYGEEYKVVECIHKEEFLFIEEYYILKTNLPYNLFSLRYNDSIPEYMLYGDGWLELGFLVILVDELLFDNDCLNTGNYKNKYGLDSEEVKNFFKEYEKYIEELYDNSIPRKYGIYKLWEEFYIDKENLGDFYYIYQIVWKKENPFTKLSYSSFTKEIIE